MAITPTEHVQFQDVRQALEIIGDKWSSIILMCIWDHPKRFSAIQTLVGGINPRTLTKKLQLLEKTGLVEKHLYKEFPPRTEYSVTAKARDLKQAMSGIKKWATKYCKCP